MTRLLHITSQMPDFTGSGIYLRALVQEAGSKGYKQCVIAGVNQEYDLKSRSFQSGISFYPLTFDSDNLPFPVVGMSDVMPYKSTTYRELTPEKFSKWERSFCNLIVDTTKVFQPDLIISHHLWILTALVKQLNPEIPIVALCHGTDLRQLQKAEIYSDYVIEHCKKIETIIALSEEQKIKIVDSYGIAAHKIFVAGGGFNPDIFFSNRLKTLEKKVIKLVFVGKLCFAKGLFSLLRAIEQLNYENIILTIVGSGSGPETEILRDYAESCISQIVFAGVVTQQELANIFRSSDLFILSSFYEGLGLVLIEALACGLRVVSTEVPGLRKQLGDEICESGIIEFVELPSLSDVDNPNESELPEFEQRLRQAIEVQIQKIINNTSVNSQLIATHVKKISWISVFNKIEERFQELIKGAKE